MRLRRNAHEERVGSQRNVRNGTDIHNKPPRATHVRRHASHARAVDLEEVAKVGSLEHARVYLVTPASSSTHGQGTSVPFGKRVAMSTTPRMMNVMWGGSPVHPPAALANSSGGHALAQPGSRTAGRLEAGQRDKASLPPPPSPCLDLLARV
jgi:hypothetical protein